MKKSIVIILLVIAFLFLVAFPGISSLLNMSEKREDLVNYCQDTSPLVDQELQMYQLYYDSQFDSIHARGAAAGYTLLKYRPKSDEVMPLYYRYLTIWDNWTNDNIADLFGYGSEDNILIKYHEDVLRLSRELKVPDEDLGNYSSKKWKEEKKIILKMSKKYLLGTD